MSLRFHLNVTFAGHQEPPFVCWKHTLTLYNGNQLVDTLVDSILPDRDFIDWILENEWHLRNEEIPSVLQERYKPVCLSEALYKFNEDITPDYDHHGNLEEFHSLIDFRIRHQMYFGHLYAGKSIPDFYVGKFGKRHEVSWTSNDDAHEWYEVDIDSLFETARSAALELGWEIPPTAQDIIPPAELAR